MNEGAALMTPALVSQERWSPMLGYSSPCSSPGCTRLVGRFGARGWCTLHYRRWLRTGDPQTANSSGSQVVPVADRFWPKVDVGEPDDCWEWQAAHASGGYGQFKHPQGHLAHRAAYLLSVGPIDPNLQINHHCDNRLCCNPGHLYMGTQLENMRDAVDRRRK